MRSQIDKGARIGVLFHMNLDELPVVAAFRFRAGDLRFPSNGDQRSALSGIDPTYAEKALGLPQAVIPTPDGQASLWLYADGDSAEAVPGWQELPARAVLQSAVSADASVDPTLFFRAYHVLQWRRESHYCGRCGTKNGDASDELARLCPACGRREYPRISPAVIVLVTRDDGAALLAHNVKFKPGLYSLVAGFVEAGETLEAAVAREVKEEVGVQVHDVRYRASQAWPFPNSLMLAFTAKWSSGHVRPDGIEIEDAQWFFPDSLPDIPGPGSVSRFLIDTWIKEA